MTKNKATTENLLTWDNDPVQILRACRCIAQKEGSFEIGTLDTLQRFGPFIMDLVAPEQIHDEILKALELKCPSIFFSALHIIGALEHIFPELDKCVGHFHGKHHRETIFEHCMLVGDMLPADDPPLRLAGYLHDMGKPVAFTPEDGRFVGHEKTGADLAESDLKRLNFDNVTTIRIVGFIRHHMFEINDFGPKGVRRLLRKFKADSISYPEMIQIRVADRIGNIAKPNLSDIEIAEIRNTFNIGFQQQASLRVTDLMLSGGEMIKAYGLEQGPGVGLLQQQMLDHVLNVGPEANTQEYLLNYGTQLLQGEN
jgi:tRNA nucleotidyltransferase/poly(A) polymerase